MFILYIYIYSPVIYHFDLFQDEDSYGITEEEPHVNPWRKQNLSLEIPSRTLEVSSKDFVQIKMPPTPKKVNFLLTPSPSEARMCESPGPSRSKSSSMKRFLPKMSFKFRNSGLDNENNTATLAPEPLPEAKPSISRSWSLTKMFTPRMKRTSSLPANPIEHSSLESVCGGSIDPSVDLDVRFWKIVGSISLIKKWFRWPITVEFIVLGCFYLNRRSSPGTLYIILFITRILMYALMFLTIKSNNNFLEIQFWDMF